MRTTSLLDICGIICLLIGYILMVFLDSIVTLVMFGTALGFFISVLIILSNFKEDANCVTNEVKNEKV